MGRVPICDLGMHAFEGRTFLRQETTHILYFVFFVSPYPLHEQHLALPLTSPLTSQDGPWRDVIGSLFHLARGREAASSRLLAVITE